MTDQKKIVLFDIDYTVFNMKLFGDTKLQTYEVYEEVHEVLEQLKEVADLGIFSQGEVAFQNRKLSETHIETYFLQKHVHIVLNKADEMEFVMKKYLGMGKMFFVDDRLPMLQLAKEHHPEVITIWIKRGRFAEEQEPIDFEADATVYNLREIIPIIKNA
ncbi:MAG: hypothetical protein ACR2LN_08250 [Candidatus Levyibacteriota bacterium]